MIQRKSELVCKKTSVLFLKFCDMYTHVMFAGNIIRIVAGEKDNNLCAQKIYNSVCSVKISSQKI